MAFEACKINDAVASDSTYLHCEDFAQQYDKCGARSGSPQLYLRDHYF